MRLVFIFLFFCSVAQAVVFPSEQDLFNFDKDEVRNPYNFMIPSPFKEEVVKKAVKLLEQKSSEVIEYTKALQVFYHLNSSQIALILNERRLLFGGNPDLKEIQADEIDSLYKKADTKKIIDFILQNELSSKQILIFIFPFLRESSLQGSEIIQILDSVSFDVNTLLKAEDMISLFMGGLSGLDSSAVLTGESSLEKIVIKPNQNLFMPDSKEMLESLKQIHSLLSSNSEERDQTLSSELNKKELNEQDIIKQFEKLESELFLEKATSYYHPEIVIGSLGHIAMAHRQEDLIRYLYKNKDFNPNLLNHIDQTPLHSLFLYADLPSSSSSKKHLRKDWERLLGFVFDNPKVDWNAKDIHGLTPLATAISKGLAEALPALFEIKDVDVSVKDNYNRSLVIIASQSLSKKSKKNLINILIKKGGGKLVMPSYFNDYIDENLNPITIQHNHPLRDVIYQASSIIRESRSPSNQVIASLAEYDYKLRRSLKAKDSLLESISQSKSSYYQQPVIQAIKKDDSGFFEKFYSKSSDIKEFIEHIFIFPVKNLSQAGSSTFLEKTDYIPSYHLLLFAIKENSPTVVQFFLETTANPYLFQPNENEISFYMDILSEALIQSFRVSIENISSKEDFERERKKSIKIINAIMSNEKVDLKFKNFMDLTPIEIAFLTGQVEKVKALQDRDISLPEGDLWDTGISYLDIVERQGFQKAGDYFREKNNITASSCYRNFIN